MIGDAAVRRAASRPARAGILHIGLGSFHRAHRAVYTAAALEAAPGPWGVIGVASRSRAVVDALRRQNDRYSVPTLGHRLSGRSHLGDDHGHRPDRRRRPDRAPAAAHKLRGPIHMNLDHSGVRS